VDRFFQGGFAGLFSGGATAQGVNSNTSALNAALITPFPAASKTKNARDNGQITSQDCWPATAPPTPLPTPVKVNSLAFYLSGFDEQCQKKLIDGFTFGFRLHFQGPSKASVAKNLISALQHPEVVDSKLIKERQSGRIHGPFRSPPFSNLRVSPLGVIPKKAPGEFRMIHHLSFPYGDSINTFIPSEFSSVKYATIDDAINFIKLLGRGCVLAKTDVRSAFRIIPVHPSDYPLLGLQWKGQWYYDRCLPMGCSSSCKIFESLSTAMEWIARTKLGIPQILHILDDFLIIGESTSACQAKLQRFLHFCEDIGVPMAPEKTEGPSPVLTFAGIELDCIRFEARLPQEKVDKCIEGIKNARGRNKITLRNLQSLIGSLNFACSVIVPGRVFLRRMINLTIGKNNPHHYIRLTKEIQQDLHIWEIFFQSFNGKSFFLEEAWATSCQLRFYTDAAKSQGYGIIFGCHWAYGEWPDEWKTNRDISFLEFFPIVVGLSMWCHTLRNKRVLFMTDNESVVHVINKQTSRDTYLLSLIRKMVFICLRNNILFRAKHIPGIQNGLADSLSRLQVDNFKSMSQGMDRVPTPMPEHLRPENWEIL